jgi:hypothetical protein
MQGKTLVALAFTAVVGVASAPAARAALLVAGGSVPAVPGVPTLDADRVLLADTGPVHFSAFAFSGDSRQWVYQEDSTSNPLGGLTFVYQLSNDPSSSTSILRMNGFDYRPFTTDVGYEGAGKNPTIFNRSANGAVVGAEFGGTVSGPATGARNMAAPSPTIAVPGFESVPAPSLTLDPGETSPLLVVRTDAPDYRAGVISIINGGAVEVAGYAPIPEPGSAVLYAAGMLTALSMRRRRRPRAVRLSDRPS